MKIHKNTLWLRLCVISMCLWWFKNIAYLVRRQALSQQIKILSQATRPALLSYFVNYDHIKNLHHGFKH